MSSYNGENQMNIRQETNIEIRQKVAVEESGERIITNQFTCPICNKATNATEKWNLNSSQSMHCSNCSSVFMFVNETRYPQAKVRVQNKGVGF